MILSHIVAVSKNFVIGINNRLPWHMPHDTAYFHRMTKGHCVIMGRINYLANKGALPGRTNIVITRNRSLYLNDAVVVHSIGAAIRHAQTLGEEEAFIVGGGEIYRQTLHMIDRIYLTIIDVFVRGDTVYPNLNLDEWNILSEIPMKKDGENPYDFTYYVLAHPSA